MPETPKHEKPAEGPEPTHRLHLDNGDVVDHIGAIPTHYSDENGVYLVVRAEKVTNG